MAGCEWEMEGGKELLGIVKKGLCKRKAFGSKKRRAFENSNERLVQMESFWFMETGNF